ncbi:hypothetical protein GW17_00039607, partial [Ensete ventricosum]
MGTAATTWLGGNNRMRLQDEKVARRGSSGVRRRGSKGAIGEQRGLARKRKQGSSRRASGSDEEEGAGAGGSNEGGDS